MRELAPNIRFLLWISNAKRVLLRPFAKSRDAQSMCQRYPYIFLTCLLLSLLTLLVSIILPSYKVIEETTRPYYIIVPSFFHVSSSLAESRLRNREMSTNAAFSIVQYLYKFTKEGGGGGEESSPRDKVSQSRTSVQK